ncbi:MAG: phosphoribosyl-ATP diphosphatase [Gordonibacter sp.]|uniref:phosphoribosyl-ATP pyrophosphatase n=1 Tax=Gordonibacter sp. TaxID=1968902 RepID=UPI002FC6588D
MSQKTYLPTDETPPPSHIGATLEALASTIATRREAGEESYTHRLLTGSVDDVLKKVMEEAGEVALAAKDVESWACSSLAAALAVEGDTGVASDEGSLGVELPAEYFDAVNHLRYETADVVYHLLVVLERFGIDLDEFAAELNNRMTDDERPQGGVRLHDDCVKRGN